MFSFFMDYGYLYVIENTFDGTYKIGHTKKPVEERLKQLSVGSSQELKIVYRFLSRHPRKLEYYLHNVLSHRHVRGEWFTLDPEDLKRLPTICERVEKNNLREEREKNLI